MNVAPRRTPASRAALALLLLLSVLSGAAASGGGPRPQAAAASRPNIILVVADDLDDRSLELMPNIGALLRGQGTAFANFTTATPACCPARASILRGQYAHNHGVLGNTPPNGGFERFRALGREESTVAVWLRGAGYRTGLFGKYLNGYAEAAAHVPPGWDEWQATAGNGKYLGYVLNENGRLVKYRARDGRYDTDVLAARAAEFVRRSAAAGAPFFAYVAPHAPHEPNVPAPRHGSAFLGAQAPRSASFNEADVSDKPAWVRALAPLDPRQEAEMDALYRRRLQSMLAVDEMVAALVGALDEAGAAHNTYVFFTSDNGWQFGEHRLAQGKGAPYEESIRVPLLVRGPGVPGGRLEARPASNIDLAPTFAALAGAEAPDFVDGRSLVPLLGGDDAAPWREAALVEMVARTDERGELKQAAGEAPSSEKDAKGVAWDRSRPPKFWVLRTADVAYVEYETGERELYDLRADPHQLDNLVPRADPEALAGLSRRLAELAGCAGAGCRAAEDAPLALPAELARAGNVEPPRAWLVFAG